MEAKSAFLRVYGDSKNFMTPHVMSYGDIGRGLKYELSKGTGIAGQLIIGVTIVEVKTVDAVFRREDLSCLFNHNTIIYHNRRLVNTSIDMAIISSGQIRTYVLSCV